MALPVAPGKVAMRKTFRIMASYRWRFAGVLTVQVIAVLATLVAPQLLGRLVTRVASGTGTAGYVDRIVLLIAAVTIVGAVINRFAQKHARTLGESVFADLRERMMHRVVHLPLSAVESAGTGDLVGRTTNDVSRIEFLVRVGIPQIMVCTVTIVFTIVAAAVLSVPLARLAVATRRFGGLLLGAFSLLYAVPSLPMLVVIPVILGVPVRSPLNMVIVLTLYGISVLVTQVAEAFRSLPEDVVEAANALGVDPWRRFCQVEMPLAVPVLIAGLRVVTASTVSLVTVGALVGVQSLGTLFTDGFQRQLVESLLIGLGATLLLALVFDLLVVLFGRALTPWLRKRKQVTA